MQSLEEFLRLFVASEMIDQEDADTLYGEFAGKSAAECANASIAKGLLTRWQADLLLRGRYKGFFWRHYKLLDQISHENKVRRLLAENLRTRKQVVVCVTPPPEAGAPAGFWVEGTV
jgi:hypothetical protein